MTTVLNRFSLRVYYEDTDAGGIVYYANYLKFAERARTEALRAIGVNQSELMANDGLAFVVTRIEVDYIASARLDDEIEIETQLCDLKKVRMTMKQQINKDGKSLVTLMVHLACVNEMHKPARIPDMIVKALTTYMTN